MVGKCCQKILILGKISRKTFCHASYGRKSSKIFRFGKCCPISGNVGLRFYDFASSENVREMRRNREPYRCASALLQAASRILNRERVLFSWNYTTAVERCCCVSGGENPTFQCKSRYYSAGEVTLPSCKCLHQPPEYIRMHYSLLYNERRLQHCCVLLLSTTWKIQTRFSVWIRSA